MGTAYRRTLRLSPWYAQARATADEPAANPEKPPVEDAGHDSDAGEMFIRRLQAYIIDYVILFLASVILLSLDRLLWRSEKDQPLWWPQVQLLANWIGMDLLFPLYFIGMHAWRGQTLGKMTQRIRVVNRAGDKPTLLQVLARELFRVLVSSFASFMADVVGRVMGDRSAFSSAPFLIWLPIVSVDCLWMCWDKERQTLHDKIGHTFVVGATAVAPRAPRSVAPAGGDVVFLRRKRRGIPIGIGLTLAVGTWLLFPEPSRPKQSLRLPDGSLQTLEAVTYGKQHRFVVGWTWQKRLLALWPGTPPTYFRSDNPLWSRYPRSRVLWRRYGNVAYRRYGAMIYHHNGDSNRMVFWTSQRGGGDAEQRSRKPFTDEYGQDLDYYSVFREKTGGYDTYLVDAHGCRFQPGFAVTWSIPGAIPRQEVYELFPRRGQTVSLGFFEHGNRRATEPIAGFTVPNPAPRTYPVWTPEPYPITKRSGNVAFTLTGLTHSNAEGSRTQATFRVVESGKPTRNWELVTITVSDATGNTITYPSLPVRDADGNFYTYSSLNGFEDWNPEKGTVKFRSLCTQESAWKLRAEFAPHFRATPDFLWTLRNVPVPKPYSITRSKAMISRQGVTLELKGIAGLQLKETAKGERAWDDSDAYARVRISSETGGLRLTLARVTDDRGRDVLVTGEHWASPSVIYRPDLQEEYDFGLSVPPGARKLNLTFAVHRTRTVEFLARPG